MAGYMVMISPHVPAMYLGNSWRLHGVEAGFQAMDSAVRRGEVEDLAFPLGHNLHVHIDFCFRGISLWQPREVTFWEAVMNLFIRCWCPHVEPFKKAGRNTDPRIVAGKQIGQLERLRTGPSSNPNVIFMG